jgi:adhesin/invasin
MRKLFILSLLAMMIAWGIGGCGGGSGGTSADPLGTDSLTLESAASQVNSNGAVALKATVKNATGTAVVGREVSFTIVSNASGATLTSSSANTDGAGEATILYRAGATAGSDVVRASISNGAKMDLNITVGGGTGSYQITLAADNTSLAAGQTAILTATVTNGSGDPVVGVVVTFAIPVNNTGAQTPTPVNGGLTDASGKAVAYYTAGSNDSLMEVYDTIRGTLANGASDAVVITRKAGTTLSVLIDGANPNEIFAGQASIITATVSGDDKAGAIVTFSAPVNNSGGCFISPSGACVLSLPTPADQNGEVVALYLGGSTTPGIKLFDTIRATLTNGSTYAIGITRIVGTIPSGETLALVAEPSSVNGGETTVITATVTGGTNLGVNEAVTLIIPVNSSGGSFINAVGASVSTVTITTGSGGTATAIYRAGTTAPGSALQDTIQGVVTSSGAINACTIERKAIAVTGYTITVTANPLTLAVPPGTASSTVTANVRDNFGTAVSGATVAFAVSGVPAGSVLPLSAATNAVGNATTTYTGNGSAVSTDTQVVTATATLGGASYSAAVIITYQ